MRKSIRIQKILNIIQTDSVLDVNKMASMLDVTPKTIRLDLQTLEDAGQLKRIHGGAIKISKSKALVLPSERNEHLEEKKAIARKALSLINENDIIVLDAGSTTYELAKLLGKFDVSVITNDVHIIYELAFKERVSLFIAGGLVQESKQSKPIIGEDAVDFFQKYHAIKTFASASAIDLEKGATIYDYGDHQVKKAIVDCAENLYFLVDSHKIGKCGFAKTAEIGEIQNLITDRGLPQSEAEKFRKKGVKVHYAD